MELKKQIEEERLMKEQIQTEALMEIEAEQADRAKHELDLIEALVSPNPFENLIFRPLPALLPL